MTPGRLGEATRIVFTTKPIPAPMPAQIDPPTAHSVPAPGPPESSDATIMPVTQPNNTPATAPMSIALFPCRVGSGSSRAGAAGSCNVQTSTADDSGRPLNVIGSWALATAGSRIASPIVPRRSEAGADSCTVTGAARATTTARARVILRIIGSSLCAVVRQPARFRLTLPLPYRRILNPRGYSSKTSACTLDAATGAGPSPTKIGPMHLPPRLQPHGRHPVRRGPAFTRKAFGCPWRRGSSRDPRSHPPV